MIGGNRARSFKIWLMMYPFAYYLLTTDVRRFAVARPFIENSLPTRDIITLARMQNLGPDKVTIPCYYCRIAEAGEWSPSRSPSYIRQAQATG